jgi:beta-ureidopropionase
MTLKIACVQLGPYVGSLQTQLNMIETLGKQALERHSPDLLILPELISTPYFALEKDNKWFALAESIPGPTTDCLSKLAVRGACDVVGTLFHKADEKYLNTAVLMGADGSVKGQYSKTHIPNINHGKTRSFESFYFSAGNNFAIWDIKGVRVGILICYDRSFPEAWRALTLNGASVVIVPASSSGFRSAMFVQELQIRAIENGVWVVAVNKGGDELTIDEANPADFYGSSCVITPEGEVVVQKGREPGVDFGWEIDTSIVESARAKLGYMEARRPDLYGDIAKKQRE